MKQHEHDFMGFLGVCRCGAKRPPAETVRQLAGVTTTVTGGIVTHTHESFAGGKVSHGITVPCHECDKLKELTMNTAIKGQFRPKEDPSLTPVMLKCACGCTSFELRGENHGRAVCTGCHAVVRAKWQTMWSHEVHAWSDPQ